MLALGGSLRHRPGEEHPKIRPRRKKISVIHSKEESDRLRMLYAVYLSVAFGDSIEATEIFLRSRLEIFGFLGWGYQSGVSRAFFMPVTINCAPSGILLACCH